MRSLFFLILLAVLLTGCFPLESQQSLITRIVDIETIAPNGSSGHGVILRSGEVLTSLHVVRTCLGSGERVWIDRYASLWCSLIENGEKKSISAITIPNTDRDSAYLSYSWAQDRSSGDLVLGQDLDIWQWVYALVNRSGRWIRLDGHILDLHVSYQAYSSDLEGHIFTGATLSDILLESGESGTPIWTLSWELIGVVSAVDRGGKKSYIVR